MPMMCDTEAHGTHALSLSLTHTRHEPNDAAPQSTPWPDRVYSSTQSGHYATTLRFEQKPPASSDEYDDTPATSRISPST